MTVYEKLCEVQSKLKAPKNQTNKFGGYNYRSCEDILEAVKPLLKEAGATITIADEIIPMGTRIYVKATACFIDSADGSTVTATAYAREEETKKGMDVAQITGSASSYARKYCLNGLLLIDDTRDPDATNDHGKNTEKPKFNREAAEMVCEDCGEDIVDVTFKGDTYKAATISKNTFEAHGRHLCWSCAKKANASR